MLARSTLIYGPAILAPRAAAFALVVVLSHGLSRPEFGLYALVIVVGETLDMSASNWIRFALLRLDITRPQAWRDGLRRSLLLFGVAVAASALLAFAIAGLLAPERLFAFSLAVVAYAASNGALRLGLAVLQLEERRRLYSLAEVARSVLLLASALAVLALAPRFEVVALANAGVTAACAVACLAVGWRGLPPGAASSAALRTRLAYGLPIVALTLAAALVAASDRVFLKLILGAGSVATYAAAYALARAPLDVVANAVNQGAFPELMRRYEAEGVEAAADFTREAFELQCLLLFGAAGLIIALSPALSQALLPQSYRLVAAQVMPIISVAAVALMLKTFVFDNVFHALKRNGLQAATYLPAGLATALACALLIPRFGLIGAAAAFGLGCVAGLASSAVYAWRAFHLSLRLGEFAKALAAAVAAGVAARLVSEMGNGAWPRLVLGSLAGGLAWMVGTALLRPDALRALWPRLDGLAWYARRLSRMSLAEAAHRVREQTRLAADRLRPPGWSAFGALGGPLVGLPGADVARASPALIAAAREESAHATAGEFDYLGRAWSPLGPDWPFGGAWTLDPVSGRAWTAAARRPAEAMGDLKYVWELNRLPFLGSVGLTASRGDAASQAFAYRALDGWMQANPPYRGVNWTSGIEAASRIASLAWLLACAPPPTPQDESRVRAFLHAHAQRIARHPSLHSSANNHRVAELAGLLLAGLCLPDAPEAAAWRDEARAGLNAEILRQFHADGVGAEQSPSYAAYSLEWFTLAGVASQAVSQPFGEVYRGAASRAAEAIVWTLDGAGRPPRIGDDDEGRVLTLRQAPESLYVASVIAFCRRWLGEAPLDAGLHDPDLRDLLGPPQDLVAPTAPPIGRRTFREGGLTVWRTETARGPAVLTFDHGPLGALSIAAHGHADALAITLSWGDSPVLIDPGTYLYHSGGAERDRLRGTAAHNTVCIDGDQSRIIGPFAWDRHARARLIAESEEAVEAEHDGYLRRYGVLHRRRVARIGPSAWEIADRFTGSPLHSVAWSAGFLLAPGCKAAAEGSRMTVAAPGGRRLRLTVDGVQGGWRIETAPYSPRFGRIGSTLRVSVGGRLSAGASDNAGVKLRLDLAGA